MHYYSWSGVLPANGLPSLDPIQGVHRALSQYFMTEGQQNDGFVGRFSSHLGQVIRSDYPLDHLSTLRRPANGLPSQLDPIGLYVEHAARLKAANL